MRLFKRKTPKNFITEVQVEEFEKDYKDLFEALRGEFNAGSEDTVETVFYFDDVNYIVRFSAGRIKMVFTIAEIDLAGRLSFEPDAGKFSTLPVSLSAFDIIAGFEAMTEQSDKDTLSNIFRAHSINRARELRDRFSSIKKVRSELVANTREVKDTEKLSFLDLSIDSLYTELKRINYSEVRTSSSLGIDSSSPNDVELVLADKNFDSKDAKELYVASLSYSGTTLKLLKDSAVGFVWADILEVILNMHNRGNLNVSYPGSDSDELELPSLDLLNGVVSIETIKPTFPEKDAFSIPEDNISEIQSELDKITDDESESILIDSKSLVSLVEEPLSGVILEPVDEYEEKEPSTEISTSSSIFEAEDDGKFFYEEVASSEETNYTAAVSDNIEPDVRRIASDENVERQVRSEIFLKSKQNLVLEDELLDIEDRIKEKHKVFNSEIQSYENLKFEAEFKYIDTDKDLLSEDPKKFEELEAEKDKATSKFFDISRLEEDRHLVNSERKNLLERISELIFEMNHEEVQGILHRVDAKLSGIAKVGNVAFSDPSKDVIEADDTMKLTGDPDEITMKDIVGSAPGEATDVLVNQISDNQAFDLKYAYEQPLVDIPKAVEEKPKGKDIDINSEVSPMFFSMMEKYGVNPLER